MDGLRLRLNFPALLTILLGFTVLAAANCPLLSVVATTSATTTMGASATYAISILNSAPDPQSITVSSSCDASVMDCSFPDLPNPFLLSGGQGQTVHLVVDTTNTPPGDYAIPLQVTGGTPGNACLQDQSLSLTVNSSTATESNSINGSVTATISPTGIFSGTPGQSVGFTVNINNPTLQDAYISLVSGPEQGNPFISSTSIAPVQFMIPAGQSQSSQVQIAIPVGWPGGLNNFEMQVDVAFPDATTANLVLPVQLFVYSPQLFLQLVSAPDPSTCANAFATNSTSVDLRVANDGTITGPYNVTIGLPSNLTGVTALSQDLFTLSQGEETDTYVNFTPTASTTPGLYYYTVSFNYLGLPAVVYDGCVNVIPVYGLAAFSTQQYDVVRGIAQSIPVSVTNNGSGLQNYSIDFNPQPIPGVALSVDTPVFTLAPSQSQTVNFLVQADSSSILGPQQIPITFQSVNSSTIVSLNIDLLSSNNTGSSPLNIIAPSQVQEFNGIANQVSITVNNNGQTLLPQVQLLAAGFPDGWVNVLTPPLDIPSATARTFLVEFDIPPDSNQPGPRVLYLTAVSGLESVQVPVLVQISQAVLQLNYQVSGAITPQSSAGSVVDLNLTVTNSGNVAETDITPSIPYATGYAVSAVPISLAPGQSGTLGVQIEPTANDAQNDVFLRVSSDQGASDTGSVLLPAMSLAGLAGVDYWPQLIAIVILVIAIAAVIKRDEVEHALSG
jgi:uncharacterized membrane protein